MKAILAIVVVLVKQANSLEFDNSVLFEAAQRNPRHICIGSNLYYHESFATVTTSLASLEIPRSIMTAGNIDSPNGILKKCSLIVLLASRLNSLNNILAWLSKTSYWDNTAWYLIFATDDDQYGSFAEAILRYGIVNSVLFLKTADNSTEMFGFDYFTNDIREFRDDREVLDFLEGEKILDVQQYPFKVTLEPHLKYLPFHVIRRMGIYGTLVETFCRFINATPKWVRDYSTKALPALFDRNAINMHPFYVLKQTDADFSFVPLPNMDGLCFLIYEIPIGSYFHHLAVPFNGEVWFTILLIIVAVRIANLIFDQQLPHDVLLGYFFGLGIADYQMEPLERFVLIAFTWFFFLTGEAYLAIMISFMNNNKVRPHLKSMAEFIKSDHHLCESQYHIYKKLEDIYPAFLQMPFDEEESCIVLLTCSDISMFTEGATTDKDVFMYTFPDRLKWFILVNTFSSRQPFAPRFGRIFSRLLESGIWELWTEDDNYARKLKNLTQLVVLSFQDLISMWWLLACGFGVASAVFVVECLVDFARSTRDKRRTKRTQQSNCLSRASEFPIFQSFLSFQFSIYIDSMATVFRGLLWTFSYRKGLILSNINHLELNFNIGFRSTSHRRPLVNRGLQYFRV